jgi:hypothetical protein
MQLSTAAVPAELIGSSTTDLVPLSGATIEIGAGAVTVGLGGTSSAVLAGVTISGLQAGDAIDLTDIPFSAGAAAFVSGTDLVISVGVNRYELGLDSSTDLTGYQLSSERRHGSCRDKYRCHPAGHNVRTDGHQRVSERSYAISHGQWRFSTLELAVALECRKRVGGCALSDSPI